MREPPAIGAVRLRHWRADDLASLLRHADDAAVSRGLGTRFPYPYTRADGEARGSTDEDAPVSNHGSV